MSTILVSTASKPSIFSPFSAATNPWYTQTRPWPPESTTPTSFKIGNNSGVLFSDACASAYIASITSTTEVVFSAALRPASAASRATVRIVPSTGLIIALYAILTPFWIASANSFALTSFLSAMCWDIPLNSWERITPEFPRAPINKPLEKDLPNSPMFSTTFAAVSFAPDDIERFIFVPVSPSGTGKTFNAFIFSAFLAKFFDPKSIISAKTSPLIFSTIFPPIYLPWCLECKC